MQNKTSKSKYLALVLRHKPESIGITLDKNGWATTLEILQGLNLSMKELEEIVNTDNKGRYSFNEDKSKIRANQGHSIPVDVELKECSPPNILYHGTGKKYLESILDQGLSPKSRLYVHLSADYDTAVQVGSRHGTPVVLEIDTKKMKEDGIIFYQSVNGVWLVKYIPSQYIKNPIHKISNKLLNTI